MTMMNSGNLWYHIWRTDIELITRYLQSNLDYQNQLGPGKMFEGSDNRDYVIIVVVVHDTASVLNMCLFATFCSTWTNTDHSPSVAPTIVYTSKKYGRLI